MIGNMIKKMMVRQELLPGPVTRKSHLLPNVEDKQAHSQILINTLLLLFPPMAWDREG